MKLITKKTTFYFDELSSADLSYICLNSVLLSGKDLEGREVKEHFFSKLSEYILKH